MIKKNSDEVIKFYEYDMAKSMSYFFLLFLAWAFKFNQLGISKVLLKKEIL